MLLTKVAFPEGVEDPPRISTWRGTSADADVSSFRKLAAVLEQMPVAVLTVDGSGKIDVANRAAQELFAAGRSGLRGCELAQLFEADGAEASRTILRPLRREVLARRRDGSTFVADLHGTRVDVPGGTLYTLVVKDVTFLRCAEQATIRTLERYRLATRASEEGIWDWDLRSGRIHLSRRWKEMLGHEEREIGEAPEEWLDRVHPADVPRLHEAIPVLPDASARRAPGEGQGERFEVEYRMRRKDGSYAWVLTRAVVSREGREAVRLTGVTTDVTHLKETEERLRHEALHDPLTGLPNRAYLVRRLEELTTRPRSGPAAALLYVDVDRLKLVNDRLGHAMGDRLLQEVAVRLRALARAGDTVARMGGDEFAILLDDIRPGDATAVADRVHRALAPPIALDGEEVLGTASVGIALARPGITAGQLLKEADAAMYHHKSRRRPAFRKLWPASGRAGQ